MALIHNVLIRILNCIYLQAPNVKQPQDIADFTTFMYGFSILLHHHHEGEEKHYFPWLEEDIGEPGHMEKNVDQHAAFAPSFGSFEDYVNALRSGKETYDGARVRKLIDDFGPILAEHLIDEIGTFEQLEALGDRIDWKAWSKRVTDMAVKTSEKVCTFVKREIIVIDHSKDHQIPLILTNMDISFEKEWHTATWPPVPWFVCVIFRWLYVPKHKGAWRFSSCDAHGNPRDLEFV